MLHPKVSVIVPVYNAGLFLRKRLDTLISQTLREIEIILVLDCPTDGSDKVATEYARQDERIILIHNPHNLHIGLSRNAGLKNARGEYICFSDHDDYSELDMLEKLYQKAREKDADVVFSNFYRVTRERFFLYGIPESGTDEQFRKDSFSYLVSGPRYQNKMAITSNGLIWNQIYKRAFLEEHQIYFQDNRKITFEDRIFLIEVYYHAKVVVRLPEALYYHVNYQGSAGGNYNYRSIDFVIHYLIYVHQFLEAHNIYEQESANYADGVLMTLYSAFRHELRHKSLKETLRKLSTIRQEATLQEALRSLFKLKNIGDLRKFRITKLCFLVLTTKLF